MDNEKIKKDLKEIDVEYLTTLLGQIKCKNNGLISHLAKDEFKIDGMMVGKDHLSFEYLREKTKVIDMLLHTIEKEILLKSGRLRSLNN